MKIVHHSGEALALGFGSVAGLTELVGTVGLVLAESTAFLQYRIRFCVHVLMRLPRRGGAGGVRCVHARSEAPSLARGTWS